MILGRNISYSYFLSISGKKISSTDEVKLLGVTVDNKQTFKTNSNELCSNASYKLHALRQIGTFHQFRNRTYFY